MKRQILASMLGTALLVLPLAAGCDTDREVGHKDTQSTNPLTGNTTSKEQTTYQRPDGSTYTNTNSNTTPANNH